MYCLNNNREISGEVYRYFVIDGKSEHIFIYSKSFIEKYITELTL